MYSHMACNGNPGVFDLSTLNAGVRIVSHRLGKVYVSKLDGVGPVDNRPSTD